MHVRPLIFIWLSCSWRRVAGAFTCCSGEVGCGGAVNDPVVCSALGELYSATNGSGWANNGGWSRAAAGVPTDYCGFSGPQCDGTLLRRLCVPPSSRPC